MKVKNIKVKVQADGMFMHILTSMNSHIKRRIRKNTYFVDKRFVYLYILRPMVHYDSQRN